MSDNREQIALLEAEVERLRGIVDLAEGLFASGALDDLTVADVRFAELVGRLGRAGGVE